VGAGFSFEMVNADDYNALRPDYAPEAVAWVGERGGLGEGSLVLDLGAGTGQLSKRDARLPSSIIAEKLRQRPDVDGSTSTLSRLLPLGPDATQKRGRRVVLTSV